jgi:hypothetical protein
MKYLSLCYIDHANGGLVVQLSDVRYEGKTAVGKVAGMTPCRDNYTHPVIASSSRQNEQTQAAGLISSLNY